MKQCFYELRQPRTTGLLRLIFAAAILLAIMIAGMACREQALATDFTRKNLAPCAEYLFGTDWMGRDMLTRTLSGLSLSIRIGVVTAAVSAVVALAAGVSAALLGRWADSALTWMIDLFMGIPHILLLVLISCACGRGFWGVTIGIVATHWMSLARLIRGEVMQLRQSGYVQVAGWSSGGYGNYVIIYHGKMTDGNAYSTLYGHMRSVATSAGKYVNQGDLIGYVGSTGNSTGNHLHLEVWKGGSKANAVNPRGYIPIR